MPNFQDMTLPPGVYATATDAENSSNWRETNFVRWENGVMAPVGGWSAVAFEDGSDPIVGKLVAVYSWFDNNKKRWVAYLTETNAYVENNGVLIDISPTVPLVSADASLVSGGYGDGPYGDSTYGTPRADVVDYRNIGPVYKFDNWGQNLLFMSSYDGRLLMWDPATPATPSAAVTNAPTNNRTFSVTPERFVILFGQGGSPFEYAWCDQEDITDWNFADVASKSGYLPIEPASPVVTSLAVSEGTMMFTARMPYIIRYIGLPYVFAHKPVSEGAIPVSPQAIVNTAVGALWFSENGLWMFDGISIDPVPCDIWAWIMKHCDWRAARFTSFLMNFPGFSEIWFAFPGVGDLTNTRVAIYNYKERWWSMGEVCRSAGYSQDNSDFPVMVSTGKVFKHEFGNSYDNFGQNSTPWAETFVLNSNKGTSFSTVRQIYPEVEGAVEDVRFVLRYANVRDQSKMYETPPRKIQANGYVDFLKTGRDFHLRVESQQDVPVQAAWRVGPIQVDAATRGVRAK